MKRAGDFLVSLSGYVLLAAVATGPWMLGSLPPWTITALQTVITAAAATWLLGLSFQKRLPPINGLLVLGTILVALGWALTLHPVASYAIDERHFVSNGAGGAGTLDGIHKPADDAIRLGALRGLLDGLRFVQECARAAAVLLDAHADCGFRRGAGNSATRRLIHLPSGSNAAPGRPPLRPVQLPRQRGIVSPHGARCGKRTHGGGARRRPAVRRSIKWIGDSRNARGHLHQYVADRCGACIGNDAGARICFWRMFAPAFQQPLQHARKIAWAVVAGLSLAAGLALFCMPEKWRLLLEQVSGEHGRYFVWRIGAGMARDAGWFGFGPGTFGLMLPLTPRFDPQLFHLAIVTYQVPGERVSMWVHAHNDLLQAFVEWGWIGGTLWTVAAGMALRSGYTAIRQRGTPVTDPGGNGRVYARSLRCCCKVWSIFHSVFSRLQLPVVLCAASLAAQGKGSKPLDALALERPETHVRIRSQKGHRVSPPVRRIPRNADNRPSIPPDRENHRHQDDL